MQSLQSPAFLRKLFKHIHRQKFVCFFNIFILKEVGISNARNVAKINIAILYIILRGWRALNTNFAIQICL